MTVRLLSLSCAVLPSSFWKCAPRCVSRRLRRPCCLIRRRRTLGGRRGAGDAPEGARAEREGMERRKARPYVFRGTNARCEASLRPRRARGDVCEHGFRTPPSGAPLAAFFGPGRASRGAPFCAPVPASSWRGALRPGGAPKPPACVLTNAPAGPRLAPSNGVTGRRPRRARRRGR